MTTATVQSAPDRTPGALSGAMPETPIERFARLGDIDRLVMLALLYERKLAQAAGAMALVEKRLRAYGDDDLDEIADILGDQLSDSILDARR